ncbi:MULTISPECIES: SPOR domain-containing protein [Marinobacter]|uniref:SPOR domain-containing protein n=1 Tax=Marinobacter TaxID=2742 RepID=UPI000DAC3FDC|nr:MULTISPECIES: SPOR domain-containing protein [Marinobacter]
MSRDYAKKSRSGGAATSTPSSGKKAKPAKRAPAKRKSAPPKQSGGLSLRWILSLALVGGFIGFIAYLNSLPTPAQQAAQSEAAQPAPKPAQPESAKPGSGTTEQKQSFEFYEMLPESEVVPPKVEAYDPGPAPAERKYRYLVQTGSFRGEKDAERQRAQIAFQGLHASIEEVHLDSGSIWYRVNVGPFENRSKMNSAVDKLVSINIEPLVRKVPKEG